MRLGDRRAQPAKGSHANGKARSIAEIEADIAVLDAGRRALLDELKAATDAREIEMLRMFDDEGLTVNEIAARVDKSWNFVRAFLYGRGRSVRGRDARRAQLASLQ